MVFRKAEEKDIPEMMGIIKDAVEFMRISGYLFQTVLATGFPSFCACTAVALVICALVQSFGLVFYSGADILAVLKGVILQTGYSIIFTFPIYLIVKWINRMDKD